MALLLDGDALAVQWRSEIKHETMRLRERGVQPCLATILVGSDAASASYVMRKHGDCAELGFASRDIRLPATAREDDVLDLVLGFNADPACHGIVVQLPLPAQIDAARVQESIDPTKDVDGLHPRNLGRLILGAPSPRPCTPAAILGLLRAYHVPLDAQRVAIIGRGLLVGRPLALMLLDPSVNAVPTILHRSAPDLAAITRESDIVIAAAGAPDLVSADMIKPGACVIGVGISYRDGKMVSDIADDVADVAAFVTPRHGSVGPLTRAMLMCNVLAAASNRA